MVVADYDGSVNENILATPVVANAAAVLRGLATTTAASKDDDLFVIKSILLAGAVKGFPIPIHRYTANQSSGKFKNSLGNSALSPSSSTYEWANTASQPLDRYTGTGYFNFRNSVEIFMAGNGAAGSNNLKSTGWDSDELTASITEKTYNITLANLLKHGLSIVLTWPRIVELNPSNELHTFLHDLKLELINLSDSTQNKTSNVSGDNIEHIYFPDSLAAGNHQIKVSKLNNLDTTEFTAQTDTVKYGFAWHAYDRQ